MPPDLQDWLPADHLARFVIDSVAQIDLSSFYGRHRDDGWGRAAYDPRMMVTRLLYAYAIGVRSAREIERLRRGHRLPVHHRQPPSRPRHHLPLPHSPTGPRSQSCS